MSSSLHLNPTTFILSLKKKKSANSHYLRSSNYRNLKIVSLVLFTNVPSSIRCHGGKWQACTVSGSWQKLLQHSHSAWDGTRKEWRNKCPSPCHYLVGDHGRPCELLFHTELLLYAGLSFPQASLSVGLSVPPPLPTQEHWLTQSDTFMV